MKYRNIAAGGVLLLGLAQTSQAFTLQQCESWCKTNNGGDDLFCIACDQTKLVLKTLDGSLNQVSCGNDAEFEFGVCSGEVRIGGSWLSLDFGNADISVDQAQPAYNAPGGIELPVSIQIPGRFSSIVKSDLAEHFRTGAPVTLEFAFVAPLFRRAIRFAYREVVISSPEQKCLEWDVDYDGKYCTKYFRRMKFSGCQFPRIMSR